MASKTRNPEYVRRFAEARETAKRAVEEATASMNQAIAAKPGPHWHILSFTGPKGGEATGVVDLIAVRKDHSKPPDSELKRGDPLQIILIQVKGGSSAMPTAGDAKRLRTVALRHQACRTLLATWKVDKGVQFFSLSPDCDANIAWIPLTIRDLETVFGGNKEAITRLDVRLQDPPTIPLKESTMSVPNIQPLLLPVLKAVADGTEHDVNDIRKRVISELRITDEEVNTNHPESQLNVYVNRVAWALVYLLEGKAITKKRSGVYQITKDGKDFLDTGEKISSIKDAKKLCA